MKSNLKSVIDLLESQLSTPIPGTPFHVVKQEKNYIIVLGNNIVAQGIDIESVIEDFEKNKWNIIWYISFTATNALNEWNKLTDEEKNILNNKEDEKIEN